MGGVNIFLWAALRGFDGRSRVLVGGHCQVLMGRRLQVLVGSVDRCLCAALAGFDGTRCQVLMGGVDRFFTGWIGRF